MTDATSGSDQRHRSDPPGRPRLIIFDVNETLSDMAPMSARFEDVGAPAHLARLWFAELLRDGFALTASGDIESFAVLAAEALRVRWAGLDLDRPLEEAVDHVMQGFSELEVHPDVVDGVQALDDLGIRLVTLSNGSAGVADALLQGAGVRDRFERLLTVEDAGEWKPALRAYTYALAECGVESQEAMLVAVHPWDIDGARRAGLATAWIDRASGRYPAYFAVPDLTAGSLVELADALR
ncbi:haloacid dehalogenase type II [Isoptericola jiangsuensis]|uniref:haloacid dehalogenase type II n=1 Tax=Isoptericola jiangsuensis TaxID=548579 RepID=UPI003AAFA996